MKNLLKLKSAIFLLLVSFVFTGCLNDLFEQRDNTLDSSVRQLAVFPASKSVNEPAGGAANGATVFNMEKVSTSGAAVNVAYTVTGTAVAGTHYTVAQGSPVSMPDGTFVVPVTVTILDSPMTAGQSVTATFQLQDSGDFTAAANISTFTLTIFGTN